jgi:hypothetical protein
VSQREEFFVEQRCKVTTEMRVLVGVLGHTGVQSWSLGEELGFSPRLGLCVTHTKEGGF